MSNRILVVDDSRDFRTLMTDLLEAAGYQVDTASSGGSAILRAVAFQPGLILMDVHMPELDGYQTCRQIKRHPELWNIPVLLMSGDDSAASRAVAAGSDAFMSKPFGLDRLLEQVRSLMGRDVCLQKAG